MAVRESDGKVVGFIVFRHKLEYDDDDMEFALGRIYSYGRFGLCTRLFVDKKKI